MPILEVENLSVAFKADRKTRQTAIRNVTFSVDSGTILGIVGESGCGKSVTASAIMGLLPSATAEITSGSIRLEGRELTRLSNREMRDVRGKKIAMIFQDPITSLNPVHKIGAQLVEMLRANENISRADAWQKATDLLKKVGVSDPERRMKSYPHELSGGMTQRVMIAMALSAQPQVLIADEPTTALDVTIQAQVLELIKELQSELGAAVLLITHDMGVVADMADNVMVMYAGEVVEFAPVKDIFKNPRHPYTRGLLRSLPRLDRDSGQLYSISGTVPPAGQEMPGCRFAPRCESCMEKCTASKPELTCVGSSQVRCHLYDGGEAHE